MRKQTISCSFSSFDISQRQSEENPPAANSPTTECASDETMSVEEALKEFDDLIKEYCNNNHRDRAYVYRIMTRHHRETGGLDLIVNGCQQDESSFSSFQSLSSSFMEEEESNIVTNASSSSLFSSQQQLLLNNVNEVIEHFKQSCSIHEIIAYLDEKQEHNERNDFKEKLLYLFLYLFQKKTNWSVNAIADFINRPSYRKSSIQKKINFGENLFLYPKLFFDEIKLHSANKEIAVKLQEMQQWGIDNMVFVEKFKDILTAFVDTFIVVNK